MVSVAVADAVVEAVKVTLMLQLLPAPRVARQVVVSANSEAFGPLMPKPLMVNVAMPVFESVTVCAALVVPNT